MARAWFRYSFNRAPGYFDIGSLDIRHSFVIGYLVIRRSFAPHAILPAIRRRRLTDFSPERSGKYLGLIEPATRGDLWH
jgi:hypothetical protein